MARRISKEEVARSKVSPADEARAEAAATAAEELEVLHPERIIEVKGEQVTVFEINFLASLRLQAHVNPIVKAIEAVLSASGALPGYDAVVATLGEHWQSTLALLQEVTRRPAEWFDDLSAQEGELLLLTFWSVNAPFFYQRVTTVTAVAREAARLLGGAKSSQPSAPTGTTAAHTPSGS